MHSELEEVQDYVLVSAKGSNKFSEAVTEKINDGYVLYKEPIINQTYLGDDEQGNPKMFIMMHQAMVLPFDDEVVS